MTRTSSWYRDISAKAVLLGGVVDIVATNVLMIPLVVVLFGNMASNLSSAAKTTALTDMLSNNPRFYLLGLILGSIASVLGGWTAAKLARRAATLNGALSSYACIAFGLYGMGGPRDTVPMWQHVVFFVLSPILGAVGGRIWERQDARRPSVEVPDVITRDTDAPASEPLAGSARALAMANRILFAGTAALAALFAVVATIAAVQRQSAMLLGGVVICVLCAGSALMAWLAARRMRAHRRHWPLHVGSLALLCVPVLLIVVPLLAAGSK